MRIVPYSSAMRIIVDDKSVDCSHAPTRYLEVSENGATEGRLIARCWHITKPRRIPSGHALVEFPVR